MAVSMAAGELVGLVLALLAGGVATGVLAGLFGVGGGAIIIAVLYDLFRIIGVEEAVRIHLCIGTAFAVIIPTSIRSFMQHRARGAVDLATLKLWALPILLGVGLGSLVAAGASQAVLKIVFITLMGLSSLRLLSGWTRMRLADELPGRWVMRLYGLFIGLLSTLMGIGGGLFGNLIMTLYNRPIHQAVATSSGLGVLISIPAAVGYMLAGLPDAERLPPFSIGYVSLLGALFLAPTSVLATTWGVRLAHGFTRRRLEVGLGLFQIIVALRLAWSLL